jgi:hypothetical protein
VIGDQLPKAISVPKCVKPGISTQLLDSVRLTQKSLEKLRRARKDGDAEISDEVSAIPTPRLSPGFQRDTVRR